MEQNPNRSSDANDDYNINNSNDDMINNNHANIEDDNNKNNPNQEENDQGVDNDIVVDDDDDDDNNDNDNNNKNTIESFRQRLVDLFDSLSLLLFESNNNNNNTTTISTTKVQLLCQMIIETSSVVSLVSSSNLDNNNNNNNNNQCIDYCTILINEWFVFFVGGSDGMTLPSVSPNRTSSKKGKYIFQCMSTLFLQAIRSSLLLFHCSDNHLNGSSTEEDINNTNNTTTTQQQLREMIELLLIAYCSTYVYVYQQKDHTDDYIVDNSYSTNYSAKLLLQQHVPSIVSCIRQNVEKRRQMNNNNDTTKSPITRSYYQDVSWMYDSIYQYAVRIMMSSQQDTNHTKVIIHNKRLPVVLPVQLLPTLIALGYTLEVQIQTLYQHDDDDEQQQQEPMLEQQRSSQRRWIQLLLDYSIVYFPKPYDLQIISSSNIVGSTTGQSQLLFSDTTYWVNDILPTFLLKLKSHPLHRTLATFYGWIQLVVPSSKSKKTMTTMYDVMQQQQQLLPTIPDEYLQLLLQKHLTHTEQEMNRYYAAHILYTWAIRSSSSFVLICNGIISMKPLPTLSVTRIAVYQLLEQLAIGYRYYYNYGSNTDSSSTILSTDLIDQILLFLYTMIQKDATKPECRIVGIQSIVEWMIVYKTMQHTTPLRTNGTGGYGTIIKDLIRTPIEQNKKLSDTAIPILSSLVKRTSTIPTTAGNSNENNNILLFIATDIWTTQQSDKKAWDKAVETVITTCASKKTMQADSIILFYVALLHYTSSSNSNVVPAWIQKIITSGNGSKNSNDSFLYTSVMIDGILSNEYISTLIPRIIAIYTKSLSLATTVATPTKMAALTFQTSTTKKPTLLSNILALCTMTPYTLYASSTSRFSRHFLYDKQQAYACIAILSSLNSILTNSTPMVGVTICIALIDALLDHIDRVSKHVEDAAHQMNASREARENDTIVDPIKLITKGHGGGYDSDSVHRVTKMIVQRQQNESLKFTDSKNVVRFWIKVLILSHVGTSIKRLHGPQRAILMTNTVNIVRTILKQYQVDGETEISTSDIYNIVAMEIIGYATRQHSSEEILTTEKNTTESNDASSSNSTCLYSTAVHRAALSLLVSLGGIAVNDEYVDDGVSTFCKKICVRHIAPILSVQVQETQKLICNITTTDIDLFHSPIGTILRPEKISIVGIVKSSGKRLTEEEEWDQLQKKEIAEKKAGGASSDATELTPEDKKLLENQDSQRRYLLKLVNEDHVRILDAVRYLCLSDIEIGNECLPVLGDIVLSAAVTTCPACTFIPRLPAKSVETLIALASGVYEIHEDYARSIASALLISHRTLSKVSTNVTKKGSIVSLPSPCPPIATVIKEIESYGDTLSGTSFAFLFLIIKASLFGPRTSVGCEGALKILYQHTSLMLGDLLDPAVCQIRKDMAIAVLELLKHDRFQTFQDPTAMETLASCYSIDASTTDGPLFTVAELAPLLDERGALGSKNCRIGAMFTLSRIAEVRNKVLKSNLLVENRIWLNCFDRDNDIRTSARKAWAIVHDVDYDALIADESNMPRPSPLYAPPLLSLLSHADSSIALAAADAYANAMARHSASVSRNITILCTTYIDSFPTPNTEASKSTPTPINSKAKAAPAVAPVTKKIAVGLPKAKAPPKSALAIAGIGQPKAAVKKKSTLATSVLLKPKQERTLDQATLDSQFKLTTTAEVEKDLDSTDKIAIRKGVLRAIAAFSTSLIKVDLDEESLKLLTSFLIAYGIADEDNYVQGMARDTLRDVVASNGGSDGAISFLLPLLEAVLRTGNADENTLGALSKVKVPKTILASDRRKEGTVVALGSVALHLQGPENDAKVDSTVDMLIGALKTPSEEVQISVSEALTKLMKKGLTQNRIEILLSNLLKDCLHGDTLATRRGAAYGLAAAVKGSGITTLKKYEIVKQLEEACSSGTASSKEGSLFAIELLCSRLGLLFEPYIIVLLPSLLQAFSDNSDHVRSAASHTTGLIMSKLSAHGVKLVMPAVLTAFNDPAWRTKQASIHMLGAMSHLAPKQLAAALPKVVPQLTEAFSDTHPKVKASAQEALNEISTVVKNPEIATICPVLLKALTDPADNTVRALESLIATEFLHAIDAPSLALISPILHRGLRDRGATTKRASSLIAGNICSMINDPKDFVPYLPTLLPDLQSALLDPIPDVRSTSAHALGSLTRSLGELIFLELRPWLIERLRDENSSSAERSGAAQGLTEVLIAAGSAIVEGTMRSEIIPLRSHPSASTREGVLWMLTFLPPSMGQGFTPLIDISLPALIGGLSDDSEPVRDVAIRAGRVLIRSHGKIHVDKILPSLEAGLISDDHRIRIASLSLLGDLLSLIGGTQLAKGESDTQDDIRKAERAQAQIALVLGAETRKRVLSGLYMARCDSVHVVRQSAIQVWKTVVSVTVRALRDILPVLVARIIDDLASGHYEKTELAGRCLGDIVGKLGDSVLPQIIPVLRKALYDGDEHTKRGVCVGLTEVIQCSSKEQILRFLEIIIPVVRDSLSDDSEVVRKMAATSFQSLHNVVGSRVMDEIVPSFMVALESGEHDEASRARALNGLVGILGVRSRELLPYIIPRLIKRPISINQAQVLAGIAGVTGSTIYYHFGAIIPALLNELADIDGKNEEKEEALRLCSQAICGSVDSAGVNWLITEIAGKCGSDKAPLRRESCRFLDCVIVARAEKEDFYEQIPIMMREMLYRLNDSNEGVLKANHSAWMSLSNKVPAEELVKHVEFMRGLIASMVSDARRRKGGVGDGEFLLPGLNMAKGVEPLIPIYQRGILYGSPLIREVSAAGLGELIDYTSSKFLAGPLIVKMTGPLLRIVGDRNPSNVKVAILQTLGRVLVKGGPALRAFVPQFQTTFVKALSDPSRHVRIEAIVALSLLMPLATRVDPLIKELIAGSLGRSASVEGLAATVVQTATLEALAAVLHQGGSKVKLPDSVPSALDASKQLLCHPDEGVRDGAAKVMGKSCALLGLESTKELLLSDLFSDSSGNKDITDATIRNHGLACAIRRILVDTASFQLDSTILEKLKKISLSFIHKDEKSIIREAGFAALGATIGRSSNPRSSMKSIEMELLKVMRDTKETIEVHRAVARCLCVTLLVIDKSVNRVDCLGVSLMDACLTMSLKGMQRVQYAFYDVLYLALSISDGTETGLNRYCELTIFDNQRAVKSLYSKVLAKMKEITILER